MFGVERDLRNILVIHFGQLGDLVLGLPALRAIRERFSDANITLMVGKATADIAKLARVADDHIIVDRVAIRDGNKLWSLAQMVRLVSDVRSRRFELVIDLHSLNETNLLGLLGGIPVRLYAHRENRSLDRLSNFRPPPPPEDRAVHMSRRYLNVLRPLGIDIEDPVIELSPDPQDVIEIEQLLSEKGIRDEALIGFFLGAGHLSRRWPIARFAELAARLEPRENTRILVFLGPEERDLLDEVRRTFSPSVIILDKLDLQTFFAALARLDVLVTNDTGPAHLAAATPASIVMLHGYNTPTGLFPLSKRLSVISSHRIADIETDEVHMAVLSWLENDNSRPTC